MLCITTAALSQMVMGFTSIGPGVKLIMCNVYLK